MTLPEDYTPHFADVEKLAVAVIDPLLRRVTPAGQVVTVFRQHDADLVESGTPVVRVQRVGGGVDDTGVLDHAQVQVAAATPSRAESWSLIGYLRDELTSIEGGTMVTDPDSGERYRIQSITEVSGPVRYTQPDLDQRIVDILLTFTVRKVRK